MNIQPNQKSLHSSCWVFPEADSKARISFMHFIEKWSQKAMVEKSDRKRKEASKVYINKQPVGDWNIIPRGDSGKQCRTQASELFLLRNQWGKVFVNQSPLVINWALSLKGICTQALPACFAHCRAGLHSTEIFQTKNSQYWSLQVWLARWVPNGLSGVGRGDVIKALICLLQFKISIFLN